MKRHDELVNNEKITYWRSIENRRRTKDYLKSIEDEFAKDISDITAIDRRSMLKVMGASIALSGLGISCRRPEEKILPYVNQPESITPGIPNFFATAEPSPFGAFGILVESHEGRPTKVEGNPKAPSTLSKSSIFNQASILELYDPDRSRYCVNNVGGSRLPVEWSDFDTFFRQKITEIASSDGDGLAFLLNADLSPTKLRLKNEISKRFKKAKFYLHDPLVTKNTDRAASLSFGEGARVRHHLHNAKIICTLFLDPFSFGPEHIRHMQGWALGRKIYEPKDVDKMNRLYAIEADYTLSGVNADHRLRLPMGLANRFLSALIYELHVNHGLDIDKKYAGARSIKELFKKAPSTNHIDKKYLQILALDLASNKGKSLIMGGEHLSANTLALVNIVNLMLEGESKTFDIIKLDEEDAKFLKSPELGTLTKDINDGKVNTLFMLNVNPVYSSAKILAFADSLKKVPTSIHMGLFDDETANLCTWHLPGTHFLEHFADTKAFDGTISIIQPLIRPLYKSRSEIELLSKIVQCPNDNPLFLVRETHQLKTSLFEKAIHDGVIDGSAYKKLNSPSLDCAGIYAGFLKEESVNPNEKSFELIVNFDRKILDGRFANNSWLQELPDPISKMDWDNALIMSPKAAKELGIKSGMKKSSYIANLVSVTTDQGSIDIPVFVLPGLSTYTVIANLGYGRKSAGVIGNDVGVDVWPLLDKSSARYIPQVKIKKLNTTYRLSTTQEQFAMNADVVQETTVLDLRDREPSHMVDAQVFKKNEDYIKEGGLPENLMAMDPHKKELRPLQMTNSWDYSTGNQWGMVIDLSSCTGCNACVLACQSENNIPVVGKEQVVRGRIMHWIRIDRYFVGDVNEPRSISQPVPCQHCENAPCEPVCPVAATSHDKEGLNAMTYNRCIGTRYCANNCPFKVRRFNYFDFTHSGNLYVAESEVERQKTLKLQRNPDVTVRYRGVMEKCSYCTQRISEARMIARRENRDPNNLPDKAVIPACAQTCPTNAITFGNIIDKNSEVAKLKGLSRNYTLLTELNVRPRTSYLSKLLNRHPGLVS